MTVDLDALGAVAAKKHGLVTRADLGDLGVDVYCRQRLLDRRVLVAAGTRAYRVVGAPVTPLQRLLVACLDVGGWASHGTALGLGGVDGFRLEPHEVLVRKGRRSVRPSDARTIVHATRWLPSDHVLVVQGVPTVSVARSLFDLAGRAPRLSDATVERAVESAVAARLATDAWLWSVLEDTRRRGRPGVARFEKILSRRASGEVTESWLERETLRILRAAGLPLPECQARIAPQGAFVARVDFLYPAHKVVIEVLGHRFHRSEEQTTADAARRRRLVRSGYEVHEFTYREIVDTPQLLVALVKDIHGLR